MTLTLAEILRGNFVCLMTPASPDMIGEFMATRIGAIALLNAFAAQEAERGDHTTVIENRAIAALLPDAAGYAPEIPSPCNDPTPKNLNAHNAALRRALIRLHEAVDASGDTAFEARILELYRQMAQGRGFDYPIA